MKQNGLKSKQARLFAFKAARFRSFLRFADNSLLGGPRTCQDDTFSIWPLLSEGKFDGPLPVCPALGVFTLMRTALIMIQTGVWGANMTVQIDDTIAAL